MANTRRANTLLIDKKGRLMLHVKWIRKQTCVFLPRFFPSLFLSCRRTSHGRHSEFNHIFLCRWRVWTDKRNTGSGCHFHAANMDACTPAQDRQSTVICVISFCSSVTDTASRVSLLYAVKLVVCADQFWGKTNARRNSSAVNCAYPLLCVFFFPLFPFRKGGGGALRFNLLA